MSRSKLMTKKECLLKVFIERGVLGLNAEEAFLLGSTCLHSDISGFKRDGLTFFRKRETLKRKQGGTKSYNRYWLSDDMIEVAKQVVKNLAKKRLN